MTTRRDDLENLIGRLYELRGELEATELTIGKLLSPDGQAWRPPVVLRCFNATLVRSTMETRLDLSLRLSGDSEVDRETLDVFTEAALKYRRVLLLPMED